QGTKVERFTAIDQMSRLAGYRKKNPAEAKLFRYISRWYHVAIRELASFEGFQDDPVWIQAQLNLKLPLPVIRRALKFLESAGYLTRTERGLMKSSEEIVRCQETI